MTPLTLKPVKEVLHTANFFGKWLPFLGCVSVKPIVEESLQKVSTEPMSKDVALTGLESDTSLVGGTMWRSSRVSSNEAAASEM